MSEREKHKREGYLIPVPDQEIIKNRDLGMIQSPLTRKERIVMSQLIGVAYNQLLDNTKTMKFRVETDDFLRLMNTDVKKTKHSRIFKSKNATEKENKYSLEGTLEALMANSLKMKYKDAKTNEYTVSMFTVLAVAVLNKKNLEFELTNWVRERILQKGGNYIIAQKIYTNLKTTYGLALYELILQREKRRYWKVELEEFKRLMGAEGKYEGRYDNLRRKIIDKAVDDINAITTYKLSYSPVREGRKVAYLEFFWEVPKKISHDAKWVKEAKRDFKGRSIAILVDDEAEVELIISNDGMLRRADNKRYNMKTKEAMEVWKKLYAHRDEIDPKQERPPKIQIGENEKFVSPENRGDAENITMNNDIKRIIEDYIISIEDARSLFKRFKNHYQSLPMGDPRRKRDNWTLVFDNWLAKEVEKMEATGETEVEARDFRLRRNVSDMIKEELVSSGYDPEDIAHQKEEIRVAGIDNRLETIPPSLGQGKERIWFYLDEKKQIDAMRGFIPQSIGYGAPEEVLAKIIEEKIIDKKGEVIDAQIVEGG